MLKPFKILSLYRSLIFYLIHYEISGYWTLPTKKKFNECWNPFLLDIRQSTIAYPRRKWRYSSSKRLELFTVRHVAVSLKTSSFFNTVTGSSNLAIFIKFLPRVSFLKDDPYWILMPTKLIFIVGRRCGCLLCKLRYTACGIPMVRRSDWHVWNQVRCKHYEELHSEMVYITIAGTFLSIFAKKIFSRWPPWL